MDTSTGLMYMGNGQYYDPQTGRFLSRNAKPDQTNPYVPWGGNPTGALFAPLALLSLVYSRKKKRGTLDIIIVLIVVGVALGLSLSACSGGTSTPPPTVMVVITTTPGKHVVQVEAGGTVLATVEFPTATPTAPPTPCSTVMVLTQTPTPAPTPADDELRITPSEFTTTDQFKAIVKGKSGALLMARVAVAEAAQYNSLEQEYIMWTIKIRAAIDFPEYLKGDYQQYQQNPRQPTSVKAVILQPGQYEPITQAFLAPDNAVNNWCNTNLQRAFNPCDSDLPALRAAYNEAQVIDSQDVKNAPPPIRDYDSFAAQANAQPYCGWGDSRTSLTKAGFKVARGQTTFQDCVLGDNVWLWSSK